MIYLVLIPILLDLIIPIPNSLRTIGWVTPPTEAPNESNKGLVSIKEIKESMLWEVKRKVPNNYVQAIHNIKTSINGIYEWRITTLRLKGKEKLDRMSRIIMRTMMLNFKHTVAKMHHTLMKESKLLSEGNKLNDHVLFDHYQAPIWVERPLNIDD